MVLHKLHSIWRLHWFSVFSARPVISSARPEISKLWCSDMTKIYQNDFVAESLSFCTSWDDVWHAVQVVVILEPEINLSNSMRELCLTKRRWLSQQHWRSELQTQGDVFKMFPCCESMYLIVKESIESMERTEDETCLAIVCSVETLWDCGSKEGFWHGIYYIMN